MGIITEQSIQIFDSQDIFGKLKYSADQWFDAIEITRGKTYTFNRSEIDNVIITGMGGAAIAGDMIRSLCMDSTPFPVIMNRSYSLPSFVNDRSLVIILSYSGDTEETISAAKHAMERNAHCIGISSGGFISSLAGSERFDLIKLNTDLSSRSAMAYFLIGIWRIFQSLEIFDTSDDELVDTGHFLREQIELFSNIDENEPAELAEEILDSLPVIYSSDGILRPVNMRWRNQIQEYAKTLAYGGILPEMNHNEIVGWERTAHLMGKVSCIMLIDEKDHHRIQKRMEITGELIEPHSVAYRTIKSMGATPLQRMLYLVLYGDFMAFFLAILSETDPAPITKIDLLKQRLKEME